MAIIHGQSVAPPARAPLEHYAEDCGTLRSQMAVFMGKASAPPPDPRDEEFIPLAPRRNRRDDDDADFLLRRLPRAPLLSSTSLRQTLRTTAMAPMAWSATNEASSRGNHTVPRERLASKQSQAMLRDGIEQDRDTGW